MDFKLIAVFIAFITSLLVSLLTAWVAYRKLEKEFQHSHQAEMIKKQMKACEQLWQELEVASFSPGSNRIISEDKEDIIVYIKQAEGFIEKLISTFHSQYGVYLSRDVRKAMFDLRDFIVTEFLNQSTDVERMLISKNKLKKYRGKITRLRISIREEIGVRDFDGAKNINSEL